MRALIKRGVWRCEGLAGENALCNEKGRRPVGSRPLSPEPEAESSPSFAQQPDR